MSKVKASDVIAYEAKMQCDRVRRELDSLIEDLQLARERLNQEEPDASKLAGTAGTHLARELADVLSGATRYWTQREALALVLKAETPDA